MDKEILKKYGIDYDKGVERFLDDTELYEFVLKTFPEDNSFEGVRTALKNGDYKSLFEHIHAMKGVTGNLDMTRLYNAACELTEAVRVLDKVDKATVDRLFDKVAAAYNEAVEGIIKADDGK